jgi:TonB family protein
MQSNEPLTLGLLPEHKRDWRTFLFSYSFCVVLVLLMLLARLIWPERMTIWAKYSVTDVIVRPDLVPEKLEIRSKPKVVKLLPVVKMEAPKLIVPKDLPRPAEAKLEPPKIQPANFDAPKLQPLSAAMPAKVIHTGEFGSSATPTVNAPIQKVQTGGFGDPNGLPGQGRQARLMSAKMGSFDLPEGAGTGNGTGGARGMKGTIASAGFGNGIAQPGQGDGRKNGQGVQTAGFAAQQVASNTPKRTLDDSAARTTQVEILYKPKPIYTDEARKLNIEGEVLLEVMFGASGELRVNRVVRGLGHGLDEAAVGAANKMKFKPAQRNGSAVDSLSIVHVVFQMAS